MILIRNEKGIEPNLSRNALSWVVAVLSKSRRLQDETKPSPFTTLNTGNPTSLHRMLQEALDQFCTISAR